MKVKRKKLKVSLFLSLSTSLSLIRKTLIVEDKDLSIRDQMFLVTLQIVKVNAFDVFDMETNRKQPRRENAEATNIRFCCLFVTCRLYDVYLYVTYTYCTMIL